MDLSYILVDFENVQPQDLDLLASQKFRVKVFHGSHRNKLDMALVKALQPLGAHVEYVQSETPGRQERARFSRRVLNGSPARGAPLEGDTSALWRHFRDGGFEPLLRHVHSLGYAAKQAAAKKGLRLRAVFSPDRRRRTRRVSLGMSTRSSSTFASTPRIARQSASP